MKQLPETTLVTFITYWGQPSKALEYYEKSLEIARKLGDMKIEAGTLNSIGLVHKGWGHYPKAAEYYETSLEIARKVEDLGVKQEA